MQWRVSIQRCAAASGLLIRIGGVCEVVLRNRGAHCLEIFVPLIALQIDSESSILETILLYSEGLDEYSAYQGEMPNGISFGHSRAQVRKRLGKPEKSGAASKRDQIPPWDRYNFGTYGLHVQYAEDERSVELVTLMVPGAKEGGSHRQPRDARTRINHCPE